KKISAFSHEYFYSMNMGPDSTFYIAANTDHFGPLGNHDIYLLKVTADGNVLWNKAYGSTNKDENPQASIFTSDSSFLVLGIKNPPSTVSDSSVVLKTDTGGNLLLIKNYDQIAYDVCERKQGGYSFLVFNDVTFWNTDENGNVTSITSRGAGGSFSLCYSIAATPDSGVITAGLVDLSGDKDALITRFDKNG